MPLALLDHDIVGWRVEDIGASSSAERRQITRVNELEYEGHFLAGDTEADRQVRRFWSQGREVCTYGVAPGRLTSPKAPDRLAGDRVVARLVGEVVHCESLVEI